MTKPRSIGRRTDHRLQRRHRVRDYREGRWLHCRFSLACTILFRLSAMVVARAASGAARQRADPRCWLRCGKVCALSAETRPQLTTIDNSPGAVQVSKSHRVKKALLMPIDEVRRFMPNSFDTVIMMGSSFGLFIGFNRAKHLLKDFNRIVSDRGQIIAESACAMRRRSGNGLTISWYHATSSARSLPEAAGASPKSSSITVPDIRWC